MQAACSAQPATSGPSGDGGSIQSKASSLGPLVRYCRHSKRWEAEPFRNLITFEMDHIPEVERGAHGKKGVRGGIGVVSLKKKRSEEGSDVRLLQEPHASKSRAKGKTKQALSLSALRLRNALQWESSAYAISEAEST